MLFKNACMPISRKLSRSDVSCIVLCGSSSSSDQTLRISACSYNRSSIINILELKNSRERDTTRILRSTCLKAYGFGGDLLYQLLISFIIGEERIRNDTKK